MALPSSGTYLQSIRDSSRRARLAANVQITDESIRRFLLSPAFTSTFESVQKSHGLAMPLNFASPLAELNVLSVLSLLNFASGYRVPLHEAIGRGAWDSVRALVMGMYLVSTTGEDDLLSSKGMRKIDVSRVAELLRVNIHEETTHESIPGLTIGTVGGPMHELCTLIAGVLTETGNVLVGSGYPDLGTFVAEALDEGARVKATKADADADVEVILERLVRAIPAFRDMAVVNDEPIYCFKKALFLIHGVVVRFGDRSPSPFPLPSTGNLPIFSDNVIPSMLVHLGVIDLSGSSALDSIFLEARSESRLAKLLRKGEESDLPIEAPRRTEGPILSKEQSVILRASAIDACEMIVEAARGLEDGADWMKRMKLSDLDAWLWQGAKDREDYRQLERFVERDTVFF